MHPSFKHGRSAAPSSLWHPGQLPASPKPNVPPTFANKSEPSWRRLCPSWRPVSSSSPSEDGDTLGERWPTAHPDSAYPHLPAHCFWLFTAWQVDRWGGVDLYSSGPTRYVTTWRERRSEQIRLCAQEDIYFGVRVRVCTSQRLFVFVRSSSLLHTRVN